MSRFIHWHVYWTIAYELNYKSKQKFNPKNIVKLKNGGYDYDTSKKELQSGMVTKFI